MHAQAHTFLPACTPTASAAAAPSPGGAPPAALLSCCPCHGCSTVTMPWRQAGRHCPAAAVLHCQGAMLPQGDTDSSHPRDQVAAAPKEEACGSPGAAAPAAASAGTGTAAGAGAALEEQTQGACAAAALCTGRPADGCSKAFAGGRHGWRGAGACAPAGLGPAAAAAAGVALRTGRAGGSEAAAAQGAAARAADGPSPGCCCALGRSWAGVGARPAG